MALAGNPIVSVMDYRDAFADWAHVASHLRHESGGGRQDRPVVSIVIPTYDRPDLLAEAVASAVAQRCDLPFEVVIVENPSSEAASARAIAALPGDAAPPIRYYVNGENLGMYANWNRGIELARGEWVTLLHDDDLLRPGFLHRMMAVIGASDGVDAVRCRTGFRDRRASRPAESRPSPLARLKQGVKAIRYDRAGKRRVSARVQFFVNELGNGLGLLMRRADALALGGFRPEQFPSADYVFLTRLAIHRRVYMVKDMLAEIGIGENESMKPATLEGFLKRDQELREALAGTHVPASWIRLAPQISANYLYEMNRFWGIRLDPDRVRAVFGHDLPRPNPIKLNLLRLAMGAY